MPGTLLLRASRHRAGLRRAVVSRLPPPLNNDPVLHCDPRRSAAGWRHNSDAQAGRLRLGPEHSKRCPPVTPFFEMTNTTLSVKAKQFSDNCGKNEARLQSGGFARRNASGTWDGVLLSIPMLRACFSCCARRTWPRRSPTCWPASPSPVSAIVTRARGCSCRPPRSTPAASSSTTSSTGISTASNGLSARFRRAGSHAARGGARLRPAHARRHRRGAGHATARVVALSIAAWCCSTTSGESGSRRRPAEHGAVPGLNLLLGIAAAPAALQRLASLPCRWPISTQ